MTEPATELSAAVQQLRPSSPAVAAHTVAVRIPARAADALAAWLAEVADLEDHSENSSHPGDTLKTARQTPGGNAEDCARRARYTTALVAAYTGPPAGRTDRMAVAAMDLADRELQQLRAAARTSDLETERLRNQTNRWIKELSEARHRLQLAHQARRAKEHQLDDIRRALCDTGLIDDADPYSHADLADVIRQTATEPDQQTGQCRYCPNPLCPEDCPECGGPIHDLDAVPAQHQRDHRPEPYPPIGLTNWTPPPICHAYQPPATAEDSGLCARCRMFDYRHHPDHDTEEQPAEPAPAWTPPPPGDTREQLPDHLLALIRPYLRGYTSTACQTAAYLASAAVAQPEHRAELIEWRRQMRKRCRRNQKYTGEICPHHTAKEN